MADYTRPYGDATTSAFPKMGEHPLVGTIVNISGNRSPYTTNRPKGGPSGDSESEPAAVRPVGRDATGEHSGPVFAPQTTIVFPNSPESSQTGRGLVTVPSVASKQGNGAFWDKRAYAGQVIS